MWSLFRKKRTTDFTNLNKKEAWIGCFLFVWMLGIAAISVAQEPTGTPGEDQDKKEYGTHDLLQSDQGQNRAPESSESKSDQQEPQAKPAGGQGQEGYGTHDLLRTGREQEESQTNQESQPTVQEPIPVPIKDEEEERSLGAQTFVDDVFLSTQNNWGFSVSAYEGYTSDIAISGYPRNDSWITSFIPRGFLNIGKRKSQFHLDVGAGYRLYNRNSELDSWDYYGNAHYSYRFSKRTSFQLYDQFTSSYNDSWSFLSLSYPLSYNFNFSNEVLFNRQRITRNSLRTELNYQATHRVRLGAFGIGTLKRAWSIQMHSR